MAIHPTVRPATVSPASPAQESARLMMKLLDQPKTIDRPFDDDDDTLPADGVLDRTELPIAQFDMIDKLVLSDGRVTESEMAKAIGRLDAPTQEQVLARTKQAQEQGRGLGKRFGAAFGSFAVGGLALVGGLVLGGPVGLVAAGLGGLGIAGGFGLALKTLFDGGKASLALFKDLEKAFSQLQ
ncbi:MAG: hypothetical protein ACK46X_17805 [Candidatus Sericytochromatia bacterium]